jgi:hypothetical protein
MGNPAARATRGQATQPGGQSRRNNPVQAGTRQMQAGQMQAGQANAPAQAHQSSGQTSRQYTQQGGSGIQKGLGEQLGGDRTAAPGATRGRGPGQRQ